MSEVKLLKLVTGEEIIASVTSRPGGILNLAKPFLVMLQTDPTGKLGYAMIPYCMYRDDPDKNDLRIFESSTLYTTDPNKSLLEQYTQLTSTLMLPKSGNVQLLRG